MVNQPSQAHLDALAQHLGFRDYATWQGYQRTRNGIIGAGQPGTGPTDAQPTNWLQHLMEKIPGHPAQLLKYVGDKFGAATGQ